MKSYNPTTPHAVSSSSCQVYPSEYAYHGDSVNRAERDSANCRKYSTFTYAGIKTEHYTHCDGRQLKLADFDLGQGQYTSSDHYLWSAESAAQLLFVFSTRISLTTTTPRYYSDSARGLSRLRFFAVPDNFDVWYAERRCINLLMQMKNSTSLTANWKLLLYLYISSLLVLKLTLMLMLLRPAGSPSGGTAATSTSGWLVVGPCTCMS